jgi:hypothetical protein
VIHQSGYLKIASPGSLAITGMSRMIRDDKSFEATLKFRADKMLFDNASRPHSGILDNRLDPCRRRLPTVNIQFKVLPL